MINRGLRPRLEILTSRNVSAARLRSDLDLEVASFDPW